MRQIGLALAVGVSAVAVMAAPQASLRHTFEVASIKTNNSGSQAITFNPSAGRFSAQNVTLSMLINRAYNLQDFQVVGGPGWLKSDHYDIEAKADGNATGKEINGTMLQALLEDRFKLVSHRESKELPVYLLTVAKNGPKLTAGTCLTREPNAPPAPGQRQSAFCGFLGISDNNLRATSIRMESLVDALSNILRRTVIDKTGFAGSFDVTLRWSPADSVTRTATTSPADNGPSIFTAVEEQLGLKLESAKGPVEVLVIDSVQRPTEN